MRTTIIKLSFAVTIPLFMMLSSCAFLDEGEIDYRKAEILEANGTNLSSSILRPNTKNGECDVITNTGEIIRATKLQRKNVRHPERNGATFSASDLEKMSIRLVSVFIDDYTEGFGSWLNDLTEGQIIQRGEIAVVVNVSPVYENQNFNFSYSTKDSGRIVFFSKDVAAGQFINFDNMPIHGPSSKGKEGIALTIWILELDTSDKVLGKLLKTISLYGTSTIIPGSSGASILSSLGDTFMGGDGADVNFRYNLLLEPNRGGLHPQAFLETGFYVFVRTNRKGKFGADLLGNEVNWSELVLDENTGRLYKKIEPSQKNTGRSYQEAERSYQKIEKPDDCKRIKYEKYKDNNYLVMRIDKDYSGRDLYDEEKSFQNFTQLLATDLQPSKFNVLVDNLTENLHVGNFNKKASKLIRAAHVLNEAHKVEEDLKELAEVANKTLAEAANKAKLENGNTFQKKLDFEQEFYDFWNTIRPSVENYLLGKPMEGYIPQKTISSIYPILSDFIRRKEIVTDGGVNCTDLLAFWQFPRDQKIVTQQFDDITAEAQAQAQAQAQERTKKARKLTKKILLPDVTCMRK